MAANVEHWEANIKVPFYLISNVAKIMGSPHSFPLVIIEVPPKHGACTVVFFPL